MTTPTSRYIETLTFTLVEHVLGRDLSPIEREVLRRRIGPNAMTQHDVGRAVGYTGSGVVGQVERRLLTDMESAWAASLRSSSRASA